MNRKLLGLLAIVASLTGVVTAAKPNFTASRGQVPFHLLSCKWVDNISSDNAEYFETLTQALAAGHRPCKDCNPDGGRVGEPQVSYQNIPLQSLPAGPPGVTQKQYQLVSFQSFEDDQGIVCQNEYGESRKLYMSNRLLDLYSVNKWEPGCKVGLLTYQGIRGEAIHAAFPYQFDVGERVGFGEFGENLPYLYGWKLQRSGPWIQMVAPMDLALIQISYGASGAKVHIPDNATDLKPSDIKGRLVKIPRKDNLEEWSYHRKDGERQVLIVLMTRKDDPANLLPLFEAWLTWTERAK